MPAMDEQQRADQTTQYIRHEMGRGLSDEAIIASLMSGGWTRGDATAAVQGARRSAGGSVPAGLNCQAPQQYQQYQYLPGLTNAPTDGREGARKARHEQGVRKIAIGCCWFFGGIIVTAVTYAAASNSPGGGTYFVAWGAVLFGAVDIIRGLAML